MQSPGILMIFDEAITIRSKVSTKQFKNLSYGPFSQGRSKLN